MYDSNEKLPCVACSSYVWPTALREPGKYLCKRCSAEARQQWLAQHPGVRLKPAQEEPSD